MRTDSTAISQQAQLLRLQVITKKYGKEYLMTRVYKAKSKKCKKKLTKLFATHADNITSTTSDERDFMILSGLTL